MFFQKSFLILKEEKPLVNSNSEKSEEIIWENEFRKSTLMWYSPAILPRLGEPRTQSISQENQQTLRENVCSGESLGGSVAVPPLRRRLREKRMKAYFKSEKNKVLYSGECDVPFRIRICGVENLFRIFEQVN